VRVLQKSEDGKLKIRTNIIVFGDSGAVVKCRKCKADIPVDIRLGDQLQKAAGRPEPRLIVPKNLDSKDYSP
jgi:hypothetical protein